VIGYEFLGPEVVLARLESVVAVYRAAFVAAPYHKRPAEVVDFAESLPVHSGRAGFRFLAARDGMTGEMAGFTYGFAPQPGQLWHDIVREQLARAGEDGWLAESFQLAQMAVAPAYQGQGVGGGLHDGLVGRAAAEQPYRRTLLTTMAAETPAFHLYRRRGWRVLGDSFQVGGLLRPYRIMGREGAESSGPRGETRQVSKT
jgi:GNAT superfamily N-acetyltransferase